MQFPQRTSRIPVRGSKISQGDSSDPNNTVRDVQLSVSEGSGYTLTTILTTTMSTLEPYDFRTGGALGQNSDLH